MQELIDFLSKYPALLNVILVMGTARMIFKPLMVFIQEVVNVTPSTKDNEIFEAIKANPIYKGFAFLLDYVGSIKLPK